MIPPSGWETSGGTGRRNRLPLEFGHFTIRIRAGEPGICKDSKTAPLRSRLRKLCLSSKALQSRDRKGAVGLANLKFLLPPPNHFAHRNVHTLAAGVSACPIIQLYSIQPPPSTRSAS